MILEGEWSGTRTVILEFEHKEAALTWYHSEEYQALAKFRFDASKADVIVIDGIILVSEQIVRSTLTRSYGSQPIVIGKICECRAD